jgi:hypothetical protein
MSSERKPMASELISALTWAARTSTTTVSICSFAHSRRPSCASTIEAATRADERGGREREGRRDEMR